MKKWKNLQINPKFLSKGGEIEKYKENILKVIEVIKNLLTEN